MPTDRTADPGYLKHFQYPPEPEGRTEIRDPLAKLALAVIKDAIDLSFRSPPRVQLNTEQRNFAEVIMEARRWLADWQTDEPFSLSWCCTVMATFSGHPWDGKAVAEAYVAGRIRDMGFNHVTRNGGKQIRVQDRHRARDAAQTEDRPDTRGSAGSVEVLYPASRMGRGADWPGAAARRGPEDRSAAREGSRLLGQGRSPVDVALCRIAARLASSPKVKNVNVSVLD